MDTSEAHPMNIDDESNDSVEEIGNPTQSNGHASTSRAKKRKRRLKSAVWDSFRFLDPDPDLPEDQPLFCECKKCDEWEKIEKICDFLEVFYDATLAFSGSLYPTSNLYFPKIFLIHLKLVEEMASPDIYMSKIANQMWEKFNKYWADFNLLLAIAVVFDPRYKYSFLEFSYAKLYGANSPQLQVVKNTLDGVFAEYKNASKTTTNSSTSCGDSEMNVQVKERGGGKDTSKSIFKEFDLFDNSKASGTSETTELKLYLEEPRAQTTSSICVLEFWKSQQYRYPVLARLARDILCVPVSTVASESAFSLGGRILDQYRSSMSPPTVEALICTRDWLFAEKVISHVDLEEVTQSIMSLTIDKDETRVTD